jgi:hypothetical protein
MVVLETLFGIIDNDSHHARPLYERLLSVGATRYVNPDAFYPSAGIAEDFPCVFRFLFAESAPVTRRGYREDNSIWS